VKRAALLLAAPLALFPLLTACSATPSDMTVHGTVTFTSVNGVPPAQAYPDVQANLTPPPPGPDGITYVPPLQVNITADDGPGNYSGQPWSQTETDMTLKSATAKVITYTFTAQVPDDAYEYQIDTVCCTQAIGGDDFSLQDMQAGPALCFGGGCPPGTAQ
jgi:hypothetical protein